MVRSRSRAAGSTELVLLMRPRVRGWVRRHQANRSDLEDLEQAAMVALVGAADRFTGPSETWPAFAWPRAIGAIYDEIRSTRPSGFRRARQRHDGEPLPVLVSMDMVLPSGDGTVGDMLEAAPVTDSLKAEELRAAISCLPVELHSVVDLVYLQDRRPVDVAALLGVSDTMVALMTGQARGLLEQSLGEGQERRVSLRRLRSRAYLSEQIRCGFSVRQVAARLGVNRKTVWEWMRFYGLKPGDLK